MESGGPPADLLRMARFCAIGEASATRLRHGFNLSLTRLTLCAQTPKRSLASRDDVSPDVMAMSQKIATGAERAVDIMVRIRDFVDTHASASRRAQIGVLDEAVGSSKAIALDHGGDLNVDPGWQGRGACLAQHLPVAAARV